MLQFHLDIWDSCELDWVFLLSLTSAYICCAHTGPSTRSLRSLVLRTSRSHSRSLRSLKLCALHSHSQSLRSLGLCTLYSLQRLWFALACAAARRFTIIIKKEEEKKIDLPVTGIEFARTSSSDLQSNALTTQPPRMLYKLTQTSPFF